MKKALRLLSLVILVLLQMQNVYADTIPRAAQDWLDDVISMQIEGVFSTWSLQDKTRFVKEMHSADMHMDQKLYETVIDSTAEERLRNVAADRIIDAEYGDLMWNSAIR
ncbi:MAG: hypothetical protein RR975_09495 [Clostridia bacterium]